MPAGQNQRIPSPAGQSGRADPRLSPQQAGQAAGYQINKSASRPGMGRTDSGRNNWNSRQPWDGWGYGYYDVPGDYGDGFYWPGYASGFYSPLADAGDYGFGPAALAADLNASAQGESQFYYPQTAPAARNNGGSGRQQPAREIATRPGTQELTARAQAAIPRPLDAGEIDPVSNALSWPSALQDDSFQPLRQGVQEYAAKWVKYGKLDYRDRNEMRKRIEAMHESLKSRIHDVAPQ
jgi:hypothetical protein